MQLHVFKERRHSSTKWTNFDPILTPFSPLEWISVDILHILPPFHVDKRGTPEFSDHSTALPLTVHVVVDWPQTCYYFPIINLIIKNLAHTFQL